MKRLTDYKDRELKIKCVESKRQGIGNENGRLMTFVSVSGTNLGAEDSTGQLVGLEEIVRQVKDCPGRKVCISGGEPLLQKNAVINLVALLADARYEVSIITNGTIDWVGLPEKVRIVLCFSSPSTGNEKFNYYDLLRKISGNDEVVMNIQTRQDYDWAVNILNMFKPHLQTSVVFQPLGGVYAKNLWRWAEEEVRVRLLINQDKAVRNL